MGINILQKEKCYFESPLTTGKTGVFTCKHSQYLKKETVL